MVLHEKEVLKMDSGSEEVTVGKFRTISTKSLQKEVKILRSAIRSKEDAAQWIEQYGILTRTQWNVKYTYPHAERVTYHNRWECALGSKNKTEKSERNTDCKVSIDIKVKLLTTDTKKKDPYLKEEIPLCGVIKIQGHHNHFRNRGDNLKFMRGPEELRHSFMGYFDDGCSPAEAIRLHEEKVRVEENWPELLADAHFNPSANTVYYWHKVWRTVNYGSAAAPLEVLKGKSSSYKEHGVTVVVREESPWCVLVVTPVMKRAQQHHSAANIIFVDTSSSCDSTNSNVTIMSTATPAGAVPIAVLIHERQTTESYTEAFKLLQKTFPKSFGGNTCPYVFMTDNADPEKTALLIVWPDGKQLLCDFHVRQAEWRSLYATDNGVEAQDRRPMMSAFQKIVYSQSAETLEENIAALEENYPKFFEKRVERLLEKKEEWVRLFRSELPIGGHHTNNFSEATIRVLKDVILERTKAFNSVALVDYIAHVWDSYLTARLAKFAYNRKSAPRLLFNDLVRRMPLELKEKIVKIDEDSYHVPSAETGNATYEVIVSIGMCSCPAGSCGAFCKHQALVHATYGGLFPNCPPVTPRDRHLLGKLAMGDKCPPPSFFLGLKETDDSLEDSTQSNQCPQLIEDEEPENLGENTAQEDMEEDVNELTTISVSGVDKSVVHIPEDAESILEAFQEKLEKVHKLGLEKDPHTYLKFVQQASKGLDRVLNHNTAVGTMMAVRSAVKGQVARFGKKIHVQSTTIGRRQHHTSKGCKRVPSGRPCNSQGSSKKKRKRQLAASIKENKPHIKKH